MKKTHFMSRLFAIALCVCMLSLMFAGCSSGSKSSSDETKTVKIGVIQFGSHPSLDNCYKGLIKGLDAGKYKGKYTIDLQNGNFESATCDQLASNMAAKNYDLIVAIATPAAVSAVKATSTTSTPVVFCAVSDPVTPGLVKSMDAPGGTCTGTSDLPDFDAQVAMIQAFQPDVKKIGVLYTTGEANSVSQLKSLTTAAKKKGIEIVPSAVQTAADIPQAAATLCAKVDCINNLTDNNVVANLTTVLEQANANNIPVYGSEVEQVKKGCLASISIDYLALGKKTGEMAAEVLSGKDPGTIPVAQITDGSAVVNKDVMSKFKLTLPDAYKDAEMVTTSTESDS